MSFSHILAQPSLSGARTFEHWKRYEDKTYETSEKLQPNWHEGMCLMNKNKVLPKNTFFPGYRTQHASLVGAETLEELRKMRLTRHLKSLGPSDIKVCV